MSDDNVIDFQEARKRAAEECSLDTMQYAKQERNFWFSNRAARDDLAALRKEIEALKAEERRIKSRVRRARETVSAAEGQIFARGMVEKLEGGES